jgi:hypothetical protein
VEVELDTEEAAAGIGFAAVILVAEIVEVELQKPLEKRPIALKCS